MKAVVSLLSKAKKAIIISHASPDPDSFAAAIAIRRAMLRANRNAEVRIVMSGLPSTSLALAKAAGERIEELFIGQVDLLVVVDTNSLPDVEQFFQLAEKKVLIDHHEPKPDFNALFDAHYTEKRTSTAELAYEISKSMKVKVDSHLATILSAAIVTDSANFIAATHGTFATLAEIMERGGISFATVLEAVSEPMGFSERIARLKGAERAKFERAGNCLIATSHVSSFEGSVARALITLGADVSFVSAAKPGDARISSRASPTIVQRGLNLGKDVMPHVAALLKGDAGGHPGAAGANGTDDARIGEAMEKCVSLTKGIISKFKA